MKMYPIYEVEFRNGEALIINEKVYKTFLDDIYFLPPLLFPKEESRIHYKMRMLKKKIKMFGSTIRWKFFPYYLVHKDEYEADY